VPDACRDQQGRLALAAIGRLDEAERTALDAHLDSCRSCRDALEELTGVASALALADPERAWAEDRPQPRPVLRTAVLSQVAAEATSRNRRRVIGFVAGAAALVLLVVAFVGVVSRPDGPTGEWVELTGDEGETATASAVLSARGWGTEISLEVAGLRPGAVYQVWLRRTDGTRVPAGSFTAVRADRMEVAGACALAKDQAAGIGVSTNGTTVLYGHLEGAPDPPQ
jgi:predicted anti-sigma-YlaC factor YlaD